MDLIALSPAAAPDPIWSMVAAAHCHARLAPDLVLLEIACEQALPAGSVVVTIDDMALPPPTAALRLGGTEAPRLLFVARDRAGLLQPGAACRLYHDDGPVAAFRLPPPIAATAMLLRVAADGPALLRFLVRTVAPLLLAGEAQSGVAAACLVLARDLVRDHQSRVQPLCRPGAALSLWAMPAAAPGDWHLLDGRTLRRLPSPADGTLVLDGPPPAGAMLLPPGEAAEPIAFAPLRADLPAMRDVLVRSLSQSSARPHRAVAALLRHATVQPRAAALLREAQLMTPTPPWRAIDPLAPVGAAIELALADRGGGIFLRGWVRDPLRLVTGMELRSGIARRGVPQAALHAVERPDLAEVFSRAAFGSGGTAPGFLAHLPEADHPAVAQWRLALQLGSGESLELTAPPAEFRPGVARDLVLQAVAPSALRPALLEHCIAPAAARLHRAAMADAGPVEIVRLGVAPRRPRAAIIVPLYRNLRFLRFQLAAFARDAALRDDVELIYVLDSPEQRGEVEHMLRGMALLHRGLALTLVVMPENRGYASACNAGAAATAAPVLALLNSDVVPVARGWLGILLRRLGRDRRLAAVGPKLLFEDGCIQHAGLLFRRGDDGLWLNAHYFKGFPRHYPAACQARRVPGVTGAALVVRRAAFLAVGGFSTDYIIGDFEDSDLCLALRAAGDEIGYEPAAELFHFERQSINGHAGHARTLAGAYNRLLQHRRWDAAIGALMPRFPEPA